jgi:hypothetical protein
VSIDNGRTERIRRAVAAGDWPAVLRLWELYAAGILDEISHGTCTRVRMAEAGELLDWAKRFAWCAQAHAQNRLNTIHAARQYGPEPIPPHASLRKSL